MGSSSRDRACEGRSLGADALELQQGHLSLEAPAEPAQTTIPRDDPMAGNDDRNWISTDRLTDRTGGATTHTGGELAVGDSLAERDLHELGQDPSTEGGRRLQVEWELEAEAATVQIFLELLEGSLLDGSWKAAPASRGLQCCEIGRVGGWFESHPGHAAWGRLDPQTVEQGIRCHEPSLGALSWSPVAVRLCKTACWSASKPRRAHFTRIGNLETP